MAVVGVQVESLAGSKLDGKARREDATRRPGR
jgi:hypothetical protein